MSLFKFLNPLRYINALTAHATDDERCVSVPCLGTFTVIDGEVRAEDGAEEDYTIVSRTGVFVVDEGVVSDVPPGSSRVVSGDKTGVKPGFYEIKDHCGPVCELTPLPETITDAPPKPGRRKPHPHVTTVAHAGWFLIVDAMKAFIRDRLYEPDTVYLDRAVETVLSAHLYEQGVVGPPLAERKPQADPVPLLNIRPHVTKLLGCRVVWDAPHFRFDAVEPVAPATRNAVSVPFGTVPMAMSVPFGTVPMVVSIPKRPTIRPIDNVVINERTVTQVVKGDVPAWKSLSEQAQALIRSTLGTQKFL